ncbi:MAG: hypothetical protein ACTMKY_05025 [Dermabacteraceae bacterium]|nr:hypothetical protein [Brachybacterium sp.]MDN6400823.1 hypothetical protein [Brachybacterium sp.]
MAEPFVEIRGLRGKEPQSIHDIVEWSGLSIGTIRVTLRRRHSVTRDDLGRVKGLDRCPPMTATIDGAAIKV